MVRRRPGRCSITDGPRARVRSQENSCGCLLLTGERDDLLGGVLHPFGDGEVQARLAQDALALLDVRAFEADDDGDLYAYLSSGLDHAARDHVAADDAAEDVYEDGAH